MAAGREGADPRADHVPQRPGRLRVWELVALEDSPTSGRRSELSTARPMAGGHGRGTTSADRRASWRSRSASSGTTWSSCRTALVATGGVNLAAGDDLVERRRPALERQRSTGGGRGVAEVSLHRCLGDGWAFVSGRGREAAVYTTSGCGPTLAEDQSPSSRRRDPAAVWWREQINFTSSQAGWLVLGTQALPDDRRRACTGRSTPRRRGSRSTVEACDPAQLMVSFWSSSSQLAPGSDRPTSVSGTRGSSRCRLTVGRRSWPSRRTAHPSRRSGFLLRVDAAGSAVVIGSGDRSASSMAPTVRLPRLNAAPERSS